MGQLDAVVVMCASVSDKSKSTCILLAWTHYPLRVNSEHTSPHPTTQCTVLLCYQLKRVSRHGGKGKGTSDIALPRKSPPQKHSGTARVLKGSHSLPAHPHVHLQSEWAIPAFAFPDIAGTYLPTPGGMEGWVGLGGWLRSETVYLSEGIAHPTTNWAHCSATALIETSVLPLH